MSAWAPAAVAAMEKLRDLAYGEDAPGLIRPEVAVGSVFDELAEPDGDMIRAGMRAIEDKGRDAPAREIVLAVWTAMIRAAQA